MIDGSRRELTIVVIIGAAGMSGRIGGLLARAGHEVIFTGSRSPKRPANPPVAMHGASAAQASSTMRVTENGCGPIDPSRRHKSEATGV